MKGSCPPRCASLTGSQKSPTFLKANEISGVQPAGMDQPGGAGTRMKIHEYQAKEIFARYGIAVPKGTVADTAAEARNATEAFGGRAVIKAQVHAGGRGKSGGVRVAQSPDDAEAAAQSMLSANLVTNQTGPEGVPVNQVLVRGPGRNRQGNVHRNHGGPGGAAARDAGLRLGRHGHRGSGGNRPGQHSHRAHRPSAGAHALPVPPHSPGAGPRTGSRLRSAGRARLPVPGLR